jgi:N-acetylmuramoyl-L-alanine amidase
VSKLRILACVLILLAGCSTATRRVEKSPDARETFSEINTPAETEHITETPPLAPPPGTIPETVHPATNHFVATWIPLKRWSAENNAGPVQRISAGPVPAFALKGTNGLLIFRANNLVAYWNGMEFHLGFPPQVVDGQPFLHTLDVTKNIEPLLHPLVLPERTNRIIVIDPGHGGSNLGTISVINGAHEKEYTLDWAKRLAPLLATNGWKVLLTRTSDVDISLTNRVNFADACKADLFVSLHFNAAPSPTNHEEGGIETFCVTPTGMPSTLKRDFEDDTTLVFPNNRFDAENLRYAMQVHRSLLKIGGARDHGVRRARFMTVLRGQNRPAILVEGGYLSNPREARRIADPAYRQKLAEAVAQALVEKVAVHPPPPTPPGPGETNSSAISARVTTNGTTNKPPAVETKATPTNSAPAP